MDIKTDTFGRTKIPLSGVVIGDRIRTELGDIDELADSIKRHGLLHPIVVDADYNLIAGGRRFSAYAQLAKSDPEYAHIPFVYFGSLPPAERKLLEIEENVKRKSMTWQENVLGIAEYHKLSSREAALEGDDWSQEATGKLLGVEQSAVSNALKLARELSNKESPLWKLDTAFEAVKFLMQLKVDEASKEALRRIQLKRELMTVKAQEKAPLVSATPVSAGGPVQVADKTEQVSVDQIASMFIHGDCLLKLKELRRVTTINHIICDPPYGIDMKNLDTIQSVSRIEDTHQVSANESLLHAFLEVVYDVIAPDGFLCMWYDLDQHKLIADRAREIGWKVQRWPFVWCKTSSCQNNAAQYNITKATEVCYFLRRSEQSILKQKRSVNYLACSSVSSSSHPFVKPHDLWAWVIETVSTEGQVIVDPFCGEGSSLLSNVRLKRECFGIELDETHIANGVQWLYSELNKKTPELIVNVSDIPL
jgi:ParB-like chromosome segregation protein Spo0J/DNA modification methylase